MSIEGHQGSEGESVPDRNWDEEFWRLADEGSEGQVNGSEHFPNYAILDIDKLPEYARYLEALTLKERTEALGHQVAINALQSRVFLNGIIGFSAVFSFLLAFAWSIYFWVK